MKMLINRLIVFLLQLFLLTELVVKCSETNAALCSITYAETLFKELFGGLTSPPSNSPEVREKFNKAKGKFRGIFPGTLWCGAGDVATNEEELGYFRETDYCCRNHDNCQNKIYPGHTNYGLSNVGLFVRSHCTCDEEFHECLKKARSPISLSIGKTYFNILRPQCFKEDYPAICKLNELSLYGIRCLEYEEDKTKDREWQWRDAKIYPARKKNPLENWPDYSEFP
ncbi:phospholipase A2-like [Leptopilina heterotoma]|uniref:phospholipase A2-like n=1 Tax=Leptopilina heterotoma TaxID=63436 RepID=UPI001CAA34FC|nr:phospholipase A2-like [Leptopilina heterotoma]